MITNRLYLVVNDSRVLENIGCTADIELVARLGGKGGPRTGGILVGQ